MAQATISIRVDQGLKRKFDSLCEAFGITTTAAFNIFMKAVVRERKIPFEVRADSIEPTRQKAMEALQTMQRTITESGIAPMTLDEINAEIKAIRNERAQTNLRGN